MAPSVHSLNAFGILQLALLCLAIYIANIFIYAFLLSPVRHIPGPWWARISRLPLMRATLQRRRAEYATKILNQYGSLVVIAPNQIHTTDENAMKTIYNKRSLKTSFYAGMGSWKGVTSTLGFIDYASAAPTRNNLIQCFQNKNLVTLVSNMKAHIDTFTTVLSAKSAAGEDIDGIVLFRLLALDIVTDVLWGEKKTLLSEYGGKTTPVFLKRFHAFSNYNALKAFIPFLETYVKFFGTTKWKQLRQDCRDLDILAKEALERWESIPASQHRDKDVLSMLGSMEAAVDEKKRVPSSHIPAYMVEMLAAGSSTTAHTATFCSWMLTQHREVTETLREELRAAFPDRRDIDERKMMDLKYLHAVIYETMRLIPIVPGPLERYLGDEITIDGMTIPPGVIASTASYTQQRLPEAFPDPNAFKPERWLTASPEQLERMHLNWTPFGYGSRSCPGSNLAMTELKYIIGTVFRFFQVEKPKHHVQDHLDLADVFVASERSGHCWLRFVETED